MTQARRNLIIVGLIALAASVTSLANGFAYDDLPIIANNEHIRDLSSWWKLFGSSYWPPQYGESLYRPVATVAYAVEWALGGGSPRLFHVVSVLLYVALSVLVLLLLRRVLDEGPAVAGGALFAAHPVHTEAVANVVGQAELLAGIGVAAAAVLYLRGRSRGGPSAPETLGIVALYVVAALSKEHALLLPLLLLAVEFVVVRAADRRPAWQAILGLTVAGALVLVARTAVLGSVFGEQNPVEMDVSTRVWTLLRVVPEWTRLLIWPANLSAEYGPQQIEIVDGPGVLSIIGLLLLIAMAAAFATARTRNVAIAMGIAWLAIAVIPVSNLASGVVLQERTLMLPSVGFVMVAGGLVHWLLRQVATPAAARAVAVLVALFVLLGSIRSATRNPVWRDNLTLFAQTARDAPRSYRAHYVYGMELFNFGRAAEGERELRQAIALSRNDSDPYNFLATKYREARLYQQAIPLYREALAIRPRRPDARFGLALSLLETGDATGARVHADSGLMQGQLKSYFDWVRVRADSVEKSRIP